MPRLRIHGYLIQPKAFTDDGENLTELPVQPIFVPRSEWANVVEHMEQAEAQLRVRVEGSVVPSGGSQVGKEVPQPPPDEQGTQAE